MKKFNAPRLGRIVALAAATALVAAACGSSDSGGDKTDTSALGTANAASGEKVVIYFIGEGKSETIDNTDETKAVVAAAKYANEYLGGLNGRPIDLKVCESKNSPAGATDCANQAVAGKAVAVINGASAHLDPQIDVLSPAKVPLFTTIGATQKALGTPGVFSMGNGLASFGSPAAFAGQKGFKSAVMLVTDAPAALGPAQQIGALAFANNGVKVDVVGIAQSTADMTPQVTAAIKSKPDMIHILGNDAFCTSALKALKPIAPDTPITVIDRCISKDGGLAIPGGYEGLNVATSLDAGNHTNAEGKIFAAVMDAYGDGADAGSTASYGYAGMLGFVRVLNAAKITDFTAAGVTTAIQNAPAVDFPLAEGIQFKCDGKQMALAPNICTADGLIGMADKDGKVAKFEAVAAGNTYNPPPAS